MAGALELVGVQAVVQGIAAFERDAASVNRLLNQINSTTVGLGSQSTTAWGLVQQASTTALTAVVTGASLAVGALAALTTATVGAAAGFENSLLKAGVAAGLTGTQIDSLGATVRKVASDTSVGLGDIENAANQLARSGIAVQDIQGGVLESTTKLAEASGGELGLAEAARLVSVAMNAWKLSASDVGSVTNTLLGAANSSAIGFTDLSTSFQLSAPLASSLHISFQDLSTAIAELGLAGVKGTVAGTALKTMLERLANPTKLAAELMSQYGISIQDANGAIVPLPEIIRRLEHALGDQAVATHKLTDAQREQIAGSLFGTRAVLDALALADRGTETFDKLSESIRKTNVEDFAAQMRQTLIPQLSELRNQMESFIIQVGTPLEKALSNGVKSINNLLRALDPAIPKAFGDALVAIFTLGGGGAGLGTEITNAFGPQLGAALNGILSIAFAVRDALANELIPAFRIMFGTITSGIDATSNLGNIFQTIAGTIKTVSTDIARAVVLFSELVVNIRSTVQGSQLLSAAITGLLISPFVGLALSLLRVVIAFSSVGIQLAIVGVAFAGMQQLILRIQATWDGSFASIVAAVGTLYTSIQTLYPALVRVGEVLLGVATIIAVRFAAQAIATANLQLLIFLARVEGVILRVAVFAAEAIIPAVTAVGAFIIATAASSAALAVQIGELAVYTVSWISATAVIIANEIALIAETAATLGWGAVLVAIRVGALLPFIAGIGLSVTGLAAQVVSFTVATVAEIAYGVATGGLITVIGGATAAALTFAGAIFSSVITAIGAFIAANAPLVLGLAAIVGVVYLVYQAFVNNFGGIRDFVNSVINFIIRKINEFIGEIAKIPAVATAIRSISDAFKNVGDTINGVVAVAVPAIQNVENEVQKYVNIVLNGMPAVDGALAQNAAQWQNWAASVGNSISSLEGPSVNRGAALADAYGAAITPPAAPAGGYSFGSPTALSLPSAGAKAPKATVDELAASYVGLLAGIRGNVQELAKFLAELEQANPGRINGMIAALQSMKGLISQIADQYQRVLAVQYAITKVQQDLDTVNAQIAANQAANEEATFALKTQVLLLDQQSLALQQQLVPLQLQSLSIQQQLLPIQQAIAAVNQQISDAQKVNYDQQGQLLDLQQQELPIKQKIADINTQINRVEDQRLTLLQRQQEITAQQSLDNLNRQLDTTNQNLNTAWQKLNVPQILALEKQKQSLTDSITSAQNSLNAIQDAQKTTRENNELTTIQLQLQVVAYQNMLKPIDDQITAINNIKAAQDAATAIVVNNLNKQKQRLEDLAAPLEAQLTAIKNQTDAINLQISVIRAQTDAINLQIAVVNNQFDLANQQFELKKLQDQTELANLQVIKGEEDARYAALIADYINTATQSGVFTASEAAETIKRLKLWDSSADAVANIAAQFDSLTAAAAAANAEIALIPHDITVRVHFQTESVPSYQYGGTVGGPIGSPQLIIAHGGEQFLGVGASKVPVTSSSAQRSGGTIVNNYNVNATYAQKQSTASIGMDLRAIIAMSKH